MATHPLTIWSITTSGGVLLFLFLLRRSKDEDDRLVAEGLAVVAAPVVPPRLQDVGTVRNVDPPPARPTGRSTMLPPVPPRVFDKPPARDAERAKIGYRRVRISSKPDPVRSLELGRLDRGDEVEIVEFLRGDSCRSGRPMASRAGSNATRS